MSLDRQIQCSGNVIRPINRIFYRCSTLHPKNLVKAYVLGILHLISLFLKSPLFPLYLFLQRVRTFILKSRFSSFTCCSQMYCRWASHFLTHPTVWISSETMLKLDIIICLNWQYLYASTCFYLYYTWRQQQIKYFFLSWSFLFLQIKHCSPTVNLSFLCVPGGVVKEWGHYRPCRGQKLLHYYWSQLDHQTGASVRHGQLHVCS